MKYLFLIPLFALMIFGFNAAAFADDKETSFNYSKEIKGDDFSVQINFDETNTSYDGFEELTIIFISGTDLHNGGKMINLMLAGVEQKTLFEVTAKDNKVVKSMSLTKPTRETINLMFSISSDVEPGIYTMTIMDQFNSDCLRFDLDTFVVDKRCGSNLTADQYHFSIEEILMFKKQIDKMNIEIEKLTIEAENKIKYYNFKEAEIIHQKILVLKTLVKHFEKLIQQ